MAFIYIESLTRSPPTQLLTPSFAYPLSPKIKGLIERMYQHLHPDEQRRKIERDFSRKQRGVVLDSRRDYNNASVLISPFRRP